MSAPTIIAITLLLLSTVLIAVFAKARTIGPQVMVGVVLGASAGISGTALITSWL